MFQLNYILKQIILVILSCNVLTTDLNCLRNNMTMTIDTPEELRSHLQWAIEVELSTIPPYLYAMYAIEDENSEAYGLIRSVAVEEMLHLALVSNLLTSVGGTPRLYDEEVIPSFPTALPHHTPELILNLKEPDEDLIKNVFLQIEQPMRTDSISDTDSFESIGEFYLSIEDALERLDEEYPIFEQSRESVAEATNRAYQMSNPNYYTPVEYDSAESGGLHEISDLGTAEKAVETIIHQGEGLRDHRYADPNHKELTHYYKFKQIADGDVPIGDTRPVISNPTRQDFCRSLHPVIDLFNACYSYLLVLLEDLFQPIDTDTEKELVNDLYAVMGGMMPPIARYLTDQPIAKDVNRHAAPTFELYSFNSNRDPMDEISELCEEAVNDIPELSHLETIVKNITD